MAIGNDEFNYESNKLKDTKFWLKKNIDEIKTTNKNLNDKISMLKKQTGGKYSYELDAAIKLGEISKKTLKSYEDANGDPYFARIDFREYRKEKESFYIGKIGLIDEKTSDEIVVDWRSPIADLYYSSTQGDASYESPLGIIDGELLLKRKFIIKDNVLIDAFDEGINQIILNSVSDESNEKQLIDEFLRVNLETNVDHKLKDIVATIQKEQNDIIRAEKNKPLVVQGSAGSGKTTVALHRLAYLLYKYKNRIYPEDILVIAPNKLFLDYISEVLPNLGIDKVKQKTFDEMSLEYLDLNYEIITKDEKLALIIEEKNSDKVKFIKNSSKVKNSMIFKTMLDRYIRYLEKCGINDEDILVLGYTLFSNKEIKKMFIRNLSHLPINRRKDEIKRYLNVRLTERIDKINNIIDDEYAVVISDIKSSIIDEKGMRNNIINTYNERDMKKAQVKAQAKKAVNKYLNNWKYDNIKEIYRLFFDEKEAFEIATDNKIPKALSDYMINEINYNFNINKIDSDDLAAMLYLKFKMDGIENQNKFQHIIVDEAQDYSMFQLSVLKSLCANNSITLVGDIGQSIYFYKGINDWMNLKDQLYKGDMEYVQLTQSYRSTVEIVEFANKVLKKQNIGIQSARPVLRHGKKPQIIKYNSDIEFSKNIDEIVENIGKIKRRSIAIIGKTAEECEKIYKLLKVNSLYQWELVKTTDRNIKLDRIIIPSYMTKGLEFDCSIIYNCDHDQYCDCELDKKLLYVILTRALHMEYVFYREKISKLII